MNAYWIIEPQFTDPDTFCRFTFGHDNARASINIYADNSVLSGLIGLLESTKADPQFIGWPMESTFADDDWHKDVWLGIGFLAGKRDKDNFIKVRVCNQSEKNANYYSEIEFVLTQAETADLCKNLKDWITYPDSQMVWKSW